MSTMTNNPFDEVYATDIMVLGIGCILFSDEGFGVRVVEKMEKLYQFPENVLLVDGGVLGINLLGVISKPKHLIVVDAIRNKGKPGDLYRLEGDAIPERIRAKNSLHQVDFLEALTLCQALDHVPKTVIVGVEPQDIETQSLDLTPPIQAQVDQVIKMVLAELERLGVSYKKGKSENVSCNPLQNNPH
jgi:hydrogenase maturation protease